VEASYQPIYGSDGANLGYRISVRDIAKRKKVEQDLIQLKKELQKRVEEQTRKLTETNTTLRVLMNSKDHDQKTMQDKLKVNIHDLVIPYLKKLKMSV
jgi:C4-dicarboxylate-specific signal transduction histidine kinase